jgi:hypothetical protein
VLAISKYFMLIQCLQNIGEGLLHARVSRINYYFSAVHGKKFHHHCIQHHMCMYKILQCCYMLHWRRMLSLRDIRSRLSEIYTKCSVNRTG